jgi:hypothetical protein
VSGLQPKRGNRPKKQFLAYELGSSPHK